MPGVLGLHHVTAIARDPQRNLDFYTGVLGLRLVKRTVNFDDPQTYHFYFGDEPGAPGSLLTFFPWPGARAGRHGTGQVAVTSFAVLPQAIGFWIERLIRHGVKHEGPSRRSFVSGRTEQVLSFADPDGLMLELVGDPTAEARTGWPGATGVTPEQAIRCVHSVTIWAEAGDATEKVLADTLGFRAVGEDGTTRRYGVGGGAAGLLINVRSIGGFGTAAGGAGTVHHVAFRIGDDAAELAMRDRVIEAGLHPTEVRDRKYFRSVYFREPGGVLFELATDTPGFTLDEPLAHLGERLMLPAHLEPRRAALEASLPRIHLGSPTAETSAFNLDQGPEDVSDMALGFVHRYIPPEPGAELAGGTTLLLLHGTGGDESDLLPLGRAILPGAGMLSPRGKVSERGANRFFRRLAEGVFDLEDLARRTDELKEFIAGAITTYGLDARGIVAVGFSNGANMAASLLLRYPGVLRGAILLSPMVPFDPDPLPALAGTAVFIGAGRRDTMIPPQEAQRLADLLSKAGADVTMHWEPGGHTVTAPEVEAAHDWLLRLTGH